jgi:hypothetical protein
MQKQNVSDKLGELLRRYSPERFPKIADELLAP